MRRFIRIAITSIAFVAVSVSCQKIKTELQQQVSEIGDVLYYFTAGFDDDATRAYANMSTGEVLWEDGDKVMALNGEDAVEFTYNSTQGKFISDKGIEWKYDCGYTMIYPSSIYKSQSYSGSGDALVVTIVLPTKQNYKEGKCCKIPMVCKSNPLTWNNTIKFKHICGILQFGALAANADKGSVTSIKFKAANVSGEGTLSVEGSDNENFTLALTMPDSATDYVTIDDEMSEKRDYYIYLPPAIYTTYTSDGVEVKPAIEITYSGGSVVKHSSSRVYIERSHLSKALNYFQSLFSGGGNSLASEGYGADAKHPYLIRTTKDLQDLATKVNNSKPISGSISSLTKIDGQFTKATQPLAESTIYYRLENDIDMNGVVIGPIGINSEYPFAAHFDGNGKTISNLTISGSENVGLFGYVTGEIKKLTLTNCNISGTSHIGGLVGYLNGGQVDSCSVSGTVTGNNYVGGIAGSSNGVSDPVSYCPISNCSNSGTISATSQYAGGIVGKSAYTKITSCSNSGTISAPASYGEIVGDGGGTTIIE